MSDEERDELIGAFGQLGLLVVGLAASLAWETVVPWWLALLLGFMSAIFVAFVILLVALFKGGRY